MGPFVPKPPENRERPGRKILRIYPYAVSRNRLDRALHEMHVPAYIVDGRVDLTRLKPVARCGYKGDYAVVDSLFEVLRPDYSS